MSIFEGYGALKHQTLYLLTKLVLKFGQADFLPVDVFKILLEK